MSDTLSYLVKAFRNFDRFFNWLYDTLKFYTQPKSFIEELVKLNIKDFTKHVLEYFIFFECVLLIIASTLIDKIQFSLYKIPGLVFLDFVLALPLIFIISFSLFIGKVENPIKKSVSFVLLFKIFYGLPIQIFFFLFIFFDDYVFYILFGAGYQLLVIVLVFFSSIFFAKRKRQTLIILITTLGLFVLYIFIYSQASNLNPSSENLEENNCYFDPIFSEFMTLKAKARLFDEINIEDEIDNIESHGKFISEDSFEKDLETLKADQKYHNELILNRLNVEAEFFNKNENYYFKSNRRRFARYLEFLNELSYFQEEYYTIFDIYRLEKSIKNLQREIELIMNEIEKVPKQKITDFDEIDFSNLSQDETVRVLEEEIKKGQLTSEQAKLQISKQNREILIWQNKIRIEEIRIKILARANELEESRSQFADEVINYYSFKIKLHGLIFIR